ncbi:zinc-binding dehydrogenase [Mycolicibacterium pulveris]|uniref:zinc-binding dehydrogenase n=1 Tax=Mycolicibacterium pulveris TaxID=36813 RepID=UPI003CF62287
MDPLPVGMTRAAVWTGTGVDIRTVALPDVGEGETLVRVRLATVCGSDLHTVAGRRPAPVPSVLGHEAVGEVVAVGVNGSADVGQRVVWSVTVTCGQCIRCRSGRTAKCLAVRKVGHEPFDGDWALSGSYAEHILLPAGTTVVPVPETLPDTVASPAACATATVMAALECVGDLAGRRVLICGAGMLGVTAAAACTEAGAHAYTTDIDHKRLEVARHFGGLPDPGGPVDVALDFSGSSAAIASMLTRLDIGAVLVLAGTVLPSPPVPIDPEVIVRQWLTITGVHNYEPRHLRSAVEFLDRTRDTYPWAAVVSEPVGFDAVAAALTSAPTGKLRMSVAL